MRNKLKKNCIQMDIEEYNDIFEKSGGRTCDFNSFLEDIAFKEPETMGDALIAFASLKENLSKKLVVKITFKSENNEDIKKGKVDSTTIERLIYENVVKSLFVKCHTQHLIFPYGILTCDNTPMDIQDYAVNFNLNIQEFDLRKSYALLLEKVKGVPIREINDSPEELKNLLFQVLWTLQCFIDVGLQHNDLHGGNILVAKYYKKRDYYYTLSSKNSGKNKRRFFKIHSKYGVKIFDFDRSTKFKTPYNSLEYKNIGLDETSGLCNDVGQCNIKNDKFDTFKILHELATRVKHSTYVNFVNQFISKELLHAKLAFTGLLCTFDQINDNTPDTIDVSPLDAPRWDTTSELGPKYNEIIYFNSSNNSGGGANNDGCTLIFPTDNQMKSTLFMLQNGFSDYEIGAGDVPDEVQLFNLPSN